MLTVSLCHLASMWFAQLNGSRRRSNDGVFEGLSMPRRKVYEIAQSLVNCCRPITPSPKIARSTFHGVGKEGRRVCAWVRMCECEKESYLRHKTSVNKERERNKVGWGRSTTPLTIFALLDDVGHFWLDNVNQGWQSSSYRSTGSIKLTKRWSSKASSSPIRPFLLSSHTVLLCFHFLSLLVLPDFPHQSYRRTSPNWSTQLTQWQHAK